MEWDAQTGPAVQRNDLRAPHRADAEVHKSQPAHVSKICDATEKSNSRSHGHVLTRCHGQTYQVVEGPHAVLARGSSEGRLASANIIVKMFANVSSQCFFVLHIYIYIYIIIITIIFENTIKDYIRVLYSHRLSIYFLFCYLVLYTLYRRC